MTSTASSSLYESRRVPRFTSYPTAPHFGSEVGPDLFAEWLAGHDAAEPLSLYAHVPFCSELCLYCGCQTTVARGYGPVAAYVGLLHKELDLVRSLLPLRPRVSHLHFGGGTPTMLSPSDFRALVARMRRDFAFDADAEVAVEIDPRTLTPAHVATLADSGVTRASLGVQSFDPLVQKTVNRLQSFELTQRLAQWLRHAGIEALNLDLMYGLPHQTVANVVSSTRQALELEPDRVAVFGYAHVPWMKRHQAVLPEDAMADAAGRSAQFEAAAEVLLDAGYVQIGLDHFARPDDAMALKLETGALRRNFQGYTTDEATTLVGLGASAISSFPQGYAQNHASVGPYRRALEAGDLPTARGVVITQADRLRAAIIERLMCDLCVDLEEICQAHRVDAAELSPDLGRLAPLVADGLAVQDRHRIVIPAEARHLVRVVSAAFDARSAAAQARYSVAL